MYRKFIYIFILFLFLSSTNSLIFGQCNPDTTCIDIGGEPGQICPDSIPQGIIGEPYEAIVTILPPAAALVFNLTIPVIKIHIDTIENLPEGIEYVISDEFMYPNTLYCAVVQGTPNETGTFPLRISVTATLNYLGGINFTVVDSTSVVFTVNQTAGFSESFQQDAFEILRSSPNPFYDRTRIGYISNIPVQAELRVYNLLGQVIYTEKMYGNSGTTYFRFSGEELRSGTFIYSIIADDKIYTGRFMKTRK